MRALLASIAVLMDVPDGSHELTLEHRCYYTVRVDVAVRPDAVGPARVNVGLPLTPYTGTPGYSEPLGGCRRPEHLANAAPSAPRLDSSRSSSALSI